MPSFQHGHKKFIAGALLGPTIGAALLLWANGYLSADSLSESASVNSWVPRE